MPKTRRGVAILLAKPTGACKMAYSKLEGFDKVNGEWERIPSVDLSRCEYDKTRKVLKQIGRAHV